MSDDFDPKDTAWLALARCKGMNADIFYPTRGDVSKISSARSVCSECPVSVECLADATHYEKDGNVQGIRAGLTGSERMRLYQKRSDRRAVRCSVCDSEMTSANRKKFVCSDECSDIYDDLNKTEVVERDHIRDASLDDVAVEDEQLWVEVSLETLDESANW